MAVVQVIYHIAYMISRANDITWELVILEYTLQKCNHNLTYCYSKSSEMWTSENDDSLTLRGKASGTWSMPSRTAVYFIHLANIRRGVRWKMNHETIVVEGNFKGDWTNHDCELVGIMNPEPDPCPARWVFDVESSGDIVNGVIHKTAYRV